MDPVELPVIFGSCIADELGNAIHLVIDHAVHVDSSHGTDSIKR